MLHLHCLLDSSQWSCELGSSSIPLFQWDDCGSERSSNLPNVTQLMSGFKLAFPHYAGLPYSASSSCPCIHCPLAQASFPPCFNAQLKSQLLCGHPREKWALLWAPILQVSPTTHHSPPCIIVHFHVFVFSWVVHFRRQLPVHFTSPLVISIHSHIVCVQQIPVVHYVTLNSGHYLWRLECISLNWCCAKQIEDFTNIIHSSNPPWFKG